MRVNLYKGEVAKSGGSRPSFVDFREAPGTRCKRFSCRSYYQADFRIVAAFLGGRTRLTFASADPLPVRGAPIAKGALMLDVCLGLASHARIE